MAAVASQSETAPTTIPCEWKARHLRRPNRKSRNVVSTTPAMHNKAKMSVPARIGSHNDANTGPV